jgi:hypothetical protein
MQACVFQKERLAIRKENKNNPEKKSKQQRKQK